MFEATVGIADFRQAGPSTPHTFEVYGDEKLLWKSKPVERWGQPQECRQLNIKGIKELELRVVCPGDAGWGMAVWCKPRLTLELNAPKPQIMATTKETTSAVTPETAEAGPPITVAVVRFEDKGTSVEFNRLGAALAEMLAHDLGEFPKLRILERTAAGDLIQERSLAEKGIVGGKNVNAEKLAAEYLVTGTSTASAGKLVVTASLTKVGGDKPLETWEHSGGVEDFMGFEAALVKQVTETLQIKSTPRRTAVPASSDASPTLAILALNNHSPAASVDVMQEGFADILQSSLGAIEGVRLVDRTQIERILAEQKLSLAGLVDPKTAVQVGQLLRAERLLVGSFLELGPNLGIHVRLRTDRFDLGLGAGFRPA